MPASPPPQAVRHPRQRAITRSLQRGFTLIELMIVVAIIGILAAIGLPLYQHYTRLAKFTEIVQHTRPYKIAVETCADSNFNPTHSLALCSAGTENIPANSGPIGKYTASITVASGIITATAVNSLGLMGETYILTPTYAAGNDGLLWNVSGTCTTINPKLC